MKNINKYELTKEDNDLFYEYAKLIVAQFHLLSSIEYQNSEVALLTWRLRSMANPYDEQGSEIIGILSELRQNHFMKKKIEEARQRSISYHVAGGDAVQDLVDLLNSLDIDDEAWDNSINNPYG